MEQSRKFDERDIRPPSLDMEYEAALAYYDTLLTDAASKSMLARKSVYRSHGFNDLFFLGVYIIGRKDMLDPWLYARCREVQAMPNGCLDLWAREHYKSTIITFLLTIQDILRDPDVTIAIFSHTRPIAKAFLRQIKDEFQNNVDLKYYFDDVLYENPKSNAPRWSEDNGIVVKRKNNPKEATLEAWGLVDGMPTSKHFRVRVYDDMVTKEAVTSPDMIAKVDYSLALSVDLGTEDGVARFIGTRYDDFDSYKSLIDTGTMHVRTHPACPFTFSEDGKNIIIHFDQAVFRDPEWLRNKYKLQGAYVFCCQQLQHPNAAQTKKFSLNWLQFWEPNTTANQNLCIIIDPSSGKNRQGKAAKKKADNDYTTMWVLGLGADNNWRVHDGIRDKLTLTERADALMDLHRMYQPKNVFYEDYGMQADIEHIKYVQKLQVYEFKITPLGGQMSKDNRIMQLMPLFEFGRILLPKAIIRQDFQGRTYNMVKDFVEQEYNAYPVLKHDDMLDCLARIEDDDVKRLVSQPQPDRKRRMAGRRMSKAERYRNQPNC